MTRFDLVYARASETDAGAVLALRPPQADTAIPDGWELPESIIAPPGTAEVVITITTVRVD